MGENPDENSTPDRSDEKLTPKQAYNMTENQGMMGKTVAKIFDVSPSRVSQLKSEYQDAKKEGRQEVSPSDFDTNELKDALNDEAPENVPYESECPSCGAAIPTPDEAGKSPCPECGQVLEWDENEI